MHTNAYPSKLPIERVTIVYIKKTIELEVICKEEENGWITVIPMYNGKQGNSFCIVNMEKALEEVKKRFNLPELTLEEFSVGVESTDFHGVTV